MILHPYDRRGYKNPLYNGYPSPFKVSYNSLQVMQACSRRLREKEQAKLKEQQKGKP